MASSTPRTTLSLVLVPLLASAPLLLGCEGEDAGPGAAEPTSGSEIVAAQEQARAQLRASNPDALPYLEEVINMSEAEGDRFAPEADEGIEVVQSSLSWYCYPLKATPIFWVAAGAVKAARAAKILRSYSHCKKSVGSLGSAATTALFEANQPLYASLAAIGTGTNICACQYIF